MIWFFPVETLRCDKSELKNYASARSLKSSIIILYSFGSWQNDEVENDMKIAFLQFPLFVSIPLCPSFSLQ